MAVPTRDAARGPPPPLPPPPPPPPVAAELEETEEQREFLLNALDVVGDWSAHDDGDGRLFYYNRKSGKSQWIPPDGFTGLEGELMMKLMLEGAVARSGNWTAHDAGNGTLYYFNAKTRASVWERPSDWGVIPPPPEQDEQQASRKEEAVDQQDSAETVKQQVEKEKPVKKDKKKKKRTKKTATSEQDRQVDQEEAHAAEQKPAEEEEELTVEEQEEAKRQEEVHMKRMSQFRDLLREKNIMPFCRWSVALPQIAGDPRFLGISTMDERRAIFEHFVKHRREDMKAEKKQKLKQAKQLFTQLLDDQFKAGALDTKMTLSMFLSTLEDRLDAARNKETQDESFAYLTISIQEKLYGKAIAEFKAEEEKRDAEAKEFATFLEEKFAKSAPVSWDAPEAQAVVKEFFTSERTVSSLFHEEKQRQVFREVSQRLQGTQPSVATSKPLDGATHRSRSRSRERSKVDSKSCELRSDASRHNQSRGQSEHQHVDGTRRRSRSGSRSSNRSRSRSRGRRSRHSSSRRHDDRHSSSRHRRRSSSRSSSRSRSYSRHRHSRRDRRSPSSSRSRSRSHSRRW